MQFYKQEKNFYSQQTASLHTINVYGELLLANFHWSFSYRYTNICLLYIYINFIIRSLKVWFDIVYINIYNKMKM